MPSTYFVILALAVISGMTTLIGVLLAVIFQKSNRAIAAGLGFAAGIMIWISLFELIPESIHAVGILKSTASLLTGVLLIFLLNLIIPHTHVCKKQKNNKRLFKTAYLCAFGLIMHDFPEGFAMANSYLYSPQLGLLIALSITLHNIPEEFAIALPIILAKR